MHMTNYYRRHWRHLAWGVALVLGSVSTASGRVDHQRPGKLSLRARDEAARKGNAKMDVLVRFRRAPGAAENLLVQGFGGKVRRSLRNSSRWMSLRLPANVVARLAENLNVEFVASDPPVSVSMDVARMASDAAPPEVPESVYKGAGVTIAMIDSGLAP